MSVDRARYPGIFVFHGDKLTVFESGVQIRYDPKVPEIVTVKTMRVDNGKYHF
jgi:hypothetical protein